MERDQLEEVVLGVIREQTPLPAGPLTPDTPLGPDGLGIDSIGVLDVLLELERRTGILLRDENLTAEAVATPAAIVRHLRASRAC